MHCRFHPGVTHTHFCVVRNRGWHQCGCIFNVDMFAVSKCFKAWALAIEQIKVLQVGWLATPPGVAVKVRPTNTLNQQGGISLDPSKQFTLNLLWQALVKSVRVLNTLSGGSVRSAKLCASALSIASYHHYAHNSLKGSGGDSLECQRIHGTDGLHTCWQKFVKLKNTSWKHFTQVHEPASFLLPPLQCSKHIWQ